MGGTLMYRGKLVSISLSCLSATSLVHPSHKIDTGDELSRFKYVKAAFTEGSE
jgi:hypothetical protein